MATPTSYDNWSKDDLIQRLQALDISSKDPGPSSLSTPARKQSKKQFDFSIYPRRKIALKFCYSGWEYNGLAIQTEPTPLPTVEAVLFNALAETRLVDRDAGLEGCEWSRCGRTDRGVSAAGQVISLWVRSSTVPKKPLLPSESVGVVNVNVEDIPTAARESTNDIPFMDGMGDLFTDSEPFPKITQQQFSSTSSSGLRYIHALNAVLPLSIRVLAWSPVADDFDARFSCQYRHYKYIFTTGSSSSAINDIPAMRDAASRLVGEHDFRNFCKHDPSKQITSFKREIVRASIDAVTSFDPAVVESNDNDTDAEAGNNTGITSGLYELNLVGTAFLWHQVRHIMAVLFLVGAGLEKPEIVDALCNVDGQSSDLPSSDELPSPLLSLATSATSTSSSLPVVGTKPRYQMADALPLMLWECGYLPKDVSWQTDEGVTEQRASASPLPLPSTVEPARYSKLYRQLYSIWTRDLIHTSLSSLFLRASLPLSAPPTQTQAGSAFPKGPWYDVGGGEALHVSKYVPLLERDRGERAEVTNARWKEGATGKRVMEKNARKAIEKRERVAKVRAEAGEGAPENDE